MNWMISDHDAHVGQLSVANISLDAGFAYPPLDEAVIRATEHGITVVVAAGNANANTNFQPIDACQNSPMRGGKRAFLNYTNPWGSVPNPHNHSAITVAASTDTDSRPGFSNFGQCVDIFAPGVIVPVLTASGSPGTGSGTSLAAPYVAGVAARHAQYFAPLGTATPGVIQGAIRDYGTPNILTNIGAGSPNLLIYSVIPKRRACCS